MRNCRIVSTGMSLPRRIVTADEMDQILGAEPGWTASKTGVMERRYVSGGETAYTLGAEAAKNALESAGLSFSDIDLLVDASGTNGQPLPCNASLIMEAMGELTSGTPAFDISSTCLSFLTALDHLSYLIEAGRYARILIVTSEVASVGLNFHQKESAALMGDGAAAVIIEKSDGSSQILRSRLETYPEGARHAQIAAGGTAGYPTNRSISDADFQFSMDGPNVYRMASKHMTGFCQRLLEQRDLSFDRFDLIIPHQASMMGLRLMQKKLGISSDKLFVYLQNYGNCIGASIPMGVHLAVQSGKIRRGDRILMVGTAAGFSIGGLELVY